MVRYGISTWRREGMSFVDFWQIPSTTLSYFGWRTEPNHQEGHGWGLVNGRFFGVSHEGIDDMSGGGKNSINVIVRFLEGRNSNVGR